MTTLDDTHAALKLEDFKKLLEIFDSKPGFERFAPRKYIVPHGYTNPRNFGVLHADYDIAAKQNMPLESTHRVIVLLGRELQRLQYPAYFVSPGLLEVALRTQPPKDIALAHLKWPLPAIQFMLPRTMFKADLGVNVNWGIIGRVHCRETHDKPQIMTVIETEESNGNLFWYHSHTPLQNVEPGQEGQNYRIGDIVDDDVMTEVCEKTILNGHFDRDRDHGINRAVMNVLYNLLLIMNACPALFEPGECVRKASGKPGKQHELWSPNFFGRAYKAKLEGKAAPSQGGTHASPRAHWRRGHFRNQRHGTGMAEIRILWIEPVFVNAPEPENKKEEAVCP